MLKFFLVNLNSSECTHKHVKKETRWFCISNPRKTFIWNRTDLRFDPSPRFSSSSRWSPQNAAKIWKLFDERDERSRRNCRIISEFVRFIETRHYPLLISRWGKILEKFLPCEVQFPITDTNPSSLLFFFNKNFHKK